MNISTIDTNFAVQEQFTQDGICFSDVRQAPFSVHGVFFENGKFRRMPEAVAKTVSEGVHWLHTNTAGGRVRFATDSEVICIRVKTENEGKMPHFALTGSIGFDLHTGARYVGTFIPPFDAHGGFESRLWIPEDLRDGTVRTYTLHLPLYSDVCQVLVGIAEDAALQAATTYTHPVPVVYYGSSITQGGCASRPGNAYENIVSYELDCDHINLGFSGNAKGEDTMIDYLADLNMSVFVCDYDHNAPTAEHLQNTHEKLFKAIRTKHPDLPVVFMTRPQPYLSKDEKSRLQIVQTTYKNALANGDRNVYFIPGPQLLNDATRNTALVDNCHPNDSGFVSMAGAVADVLRKILK